MNQVRVKRMQVRCDWVIAIDSWMLQPHLQQWLSKSWTALQLIDRTDCTGCPFAGGQNTRCCTDLQISSSGSTSSSDWDVHIHVHICTSKSPSICSTRLPCSTSFFQNDEIRTKKLCCFWSDLMELAATDRSWPIIVSKWATEFNELITVSVLCVFQDHLYDLFLQSLSNIIIVPPWQFRLQGSLREHECPYLLTYFEPI